MTAIKQGANAVISSHCGPKAFRVLQEAGVKVYLTKAAKCREALQLFQDGKLQEASSANVEGHWT